MESWPKCGPGGVLTGIYGTRRIEYLRVRQFDESDATPTVIEGHVKQAMQQLWSWPY
jgi:hypothetical protein